MRDRSIFYLRYFVFGLSAIGVPLLFMVNGAILLNRKLRLRDHAGKTVRLYALALIWSALSLLAMWPLVEDLDNVRQILKVVLLLKVEINNHLWFLSTLTAIYVMLPMVKFPCDQASSALIAWLLSAVLLFSFGVDLLGWSGNAVLIPLGHDRTPPGLDSAVHLFDEQGVNPFSASAWALGYFLIDGLLERRAVRDRMQAASATLGVVFLAAYGLLFAYGLLASRLTLATMFDIVFDSYRSPPCLVMSVALYMMFNRAGRPGERARRLFTSIGQNKLGILLLHNLLIHWLDRCCHPDGIPGHFGYAVSVFALSWALSAIARLIPRGAILLRL